MKKLLVVLLTVVLVFSFVTMTYAAKTTWSGGGGDFWFFDQIQSGAAGVSSYGTYFCLDAIGVQVTGDNDTYAKAWVNVDSFRTLGWAGMAAWGGTNVPWACFAVGINKIGGSGLSLAYNTKDDGYGMGINIGQAIMTDSFLDYHTDTSFQTNNWLNCLYLNYTQGNFTLKSQYFAPIMMFNPSWAPYGPATNGGVLVPPGTNPSPDGLSNNLDPCTFMGSWGADFIYKLDNGQQVYLGYMNQQYNTGDNQAAMVDLGGNLKFGDVGLTLDIWDNFSKNHDLIEYGDDQSDVSIVDGNQSLVFQGDVSMKFGDLPFDGILMYASPANTALNSTLGVGLKLGLTNKLGVGVKYFSQQGGLDNGSAYNVNLTYNVGVLDLVLGDWDYGAQSNEKCVYFGVHANLW